MLDHFGMLAPFYEKLIKPRFPEGLIKQLDIQPGDKLLDVGGGTGRITQYFSDITETIMILDESCDMLKEANKKPRLQPLCASSEEIPIKDNSIERLIMIDAMHHVKNQDATAKEMWRILKPKGRLIIEEPDIRLRGIKLLAIGEKLLMMRSRFLSSEKIEMLFNYPNASIREMQDGYNVWIIVEKS
ncbi:MAG TPA: class I SAM-dependent methyltransferase [Anaerolineae bacterium]|nr:class I SAM-dependent methyltransferase [Anaerolineae bacterium]